MMQRPLRPGDVVAGKYRVERIIGIGGMGVVAAARHLEIGRRVALKFMRADALDKGGVDRLLREARVAASIESEHVAQVLDVGRTQLGEPYLVMELLEGWDLAAGITRGVARTEDAVGWILEACEGLAAAHARGLVHRDVKPANLFLATRADGRATLKVLDFGLARTFEGDDASVTTTGSVLGSPQYMAPEQLLARALDARTDVWALGVCLYELLTGAVPFEAPTVPALCAKILKEEPRDPTGLRPDLDHRLLAVLFECMRRDPDERYATVADLAAALEPFAPHAEGAADRVGNVLRSAARELPVYETPMPGTDAPTRIVTAYDSPKAPARAGRRSVTVALAALGVLGVLAAVVLVVAVAQHRDPDPIVVAGTRSAPLAATASASPSSPAFALPATQGDTEPTEAVVAPTAAPTHVRIHPTARPRPSAPSSSNPLGRF